MTRTYAIMSGTAPDGTPLLVAIDMEQVDDERCEASYGAPHSVRAWCTRSRGHGGAWHVATTGTEIIMAWPNEA